MRRSSCKLIALAALITICPSASGQDALAAGGPYKLVNADPEGSFVLSGMKHGAEPESLQAWIWTIYPQPKDVEGEKYDSFTQRAIIRCSSRSIEIVDAEYYLDGEGRDAPFTARLPRTPRADDPMDKVWEMACDSAVRFQAKTFTSLAEVISEMRKRLDLTASAAARPDSHLDR